MQLRNYLLLIGTAVGAGIFALPEVVTTIGLAPFFFILVSLAISTGVLNYFYFQIVQSVKSHHQLTGYAHIVLGKKARVIAAWLQILGLGGALIAFVTLGSSYVSSLFGIGTIPSLIFFWSLIVIPFLFLGKHLELFDYIAISLKIILFTLLAGVALLLLFYNMPPTIIHPTTQSIAAGYGAVLFALASFSIVPEMKRMPHGARSTFMWTQLTLIVLYFVFGAGLTGVIDGDGAITATGWMGRVLTGAGIIAVYTPCMLFMWVTHDLLTHDLGFSSRESKTLISLAPPIVASMGIAQFTWIVAITGGIVMSAKGILISEMYKVRFNRHLFLTTALQGILLLGIVSVIMKLILQ